MAFALPDGSTVPSGKVTTSVTGTTYKPTKPVSSSQLIIKQDNGNMTTYDMNYDTIPAGAYAMPGKNILDIALMVLVGITVLKIVR